MKSIHLKILPPKSIWWHKDFYEHWIELTDAGTSSSTAFTTSSDTSSRFIPSGTTIMVSEGVHTVIARAGLPETFKDLCELFGLVTTRAVFIAFSRDGWIDRMEREINRAEHGGALYSSRRSKWSRIAWSISACDHHSSAFASTLDTALDTVLCDWSIGCKGKCPYKDSLIQCKNFIVLTGNFLRTLQWMTNQRDYSCRLVYQPKSCKFCQTRTTMITSKSSSCGKKTTTNRSRVTSEDQKKKCHSQCTCAQLADVFALQALESQNFWILTLRQDVFS